MAYSDFTFTQSGGTEQATANSGLSSPLAIGGGFCRRLDSTAVSSSYSYLRLNAANFNDVPYTRAIQLEACMRLEYAQNTNSTPGMWLLAKHSGTTPGGSSTNGYRLGIAGNGSGYAPQIYSGSTPIAGAAAVSLNTWYRLRFEVFPLGLGGDRLIAKREMTLGSGTWTTIMDITLANSSPYYIPWGATRTNGICVSSFNTTYAVRGYFDLFNAAVAVTP